MGPRAGKDFSEDLVFRPGSLRLGSFSMADFMVLEIRDEKRYHVEFVARSNKRIKRHLGVLELGPCYLH